MKRGTQRRLHVRYGVWLNMRHWFHQIVGVRWMR